MKIFLIDNYDSFTFNLVHYLETFDVSVTVKRNDEFQLNEIENYDRIVLSPGPKLPKDAGLMMQVIQKYYNKKPILGICLGHQALAEYFGAELYNMTDIYHGMSTMINVDNASTIFKSLPSKLKVGRYHSWAVKNLPKELNAIAKTDEGVIMGFEHKQLPIVGLQFHPESIMTTKGLNIIENWINL